MPNAFASAGGRRAWVALILIAALRLAWLASAFIFGAADVRRHHVESAAFIFGGLLTLSAIWFARGADGPRRATPAVLPAFIIGVTIIAIALYYPVLSIGLLSDDFVLLTWAARWDLLPASWDFIRPVPLALWATLNAILPGSLLPVALHAINLTLHVVNAWLLMRLATALGLTRERALAAGLIFVAWPLNVEAVAWAAAVFDQLLVTCAVLLASLAVAPSPTRRSAAIAAGVTTVALLTKETAVVLPVLAAIAVVAARSDLRGNRAVIVSVSLTIAYGLLRLLLKGTTVPSMPPLSGYAVKEMLGRPFAALSVPVHQDVLIALPAVSTTFVVAVIAAFAIAAIGWHARPSNARRAIGLALWILVGVAPLLTNLFVGPELQGSRYLYLPTVAWALLLADALPMERSTAARVAAIACVAIVLAASVAVTRAHVTYWTVAGELRDRTLADIAARAPGCGTATIAVPAAHRGAYVFVNGLTEALRMTNVQATPGPLGSARVGECQLVPTVNGR